MAKAVGVSPATVRIWVAHGLKPHLFRTFKISRDPNFVEKLEDVIGLYLSPPENAIVLSCDEKSQIQALDRTQPLPERWPLTHLHRCAPVTGSGRTPAIVWQTCSKTPESDKRVGRLDVPYLPRTCLNAALARSALSRRQLNPQLRTLEVAHHEPDTAPEPALLVPDLGDVGAQPHGDDTLTARKANRALVS